MRLVRAPRASAILYSLLVQRAEKRPWLLPANICPIVPITFLKAQVPFHFVDISAGSLQMDLDQAETWLRKHPLDGILYAHTYGEASTPHDFFETIKKSFPEVTVVDDRCLCVPDLEADPTSRADIQLYSTGYAKIVDLDFGGYAFLGNEIEYEPVQLPLQVRHAEELETSYKEAVRRRTKFVYQDSDWLDTGSPVPGWEEYGERIEKQRMQSLEHRFTLNQIYRSLLPPEIQLPPQFQTWRFNISVRGKQNILEAIFSSGLFASSHYASLASIMDDDWAPHAEGLADRVINLFNDHHFTSDQAEQICKIVVENLS